MRVSEGGRNGGLESHFGADGRKKERKKAGEERERDGLIVLVAFCSRRRTPFLILGTSSPSLFCSFQLHQLPWEGGEVWRRILRRRVQESTFRVSAQSQKLKTKTTDARATPLEIHALFCRLGYAESQRERGGGRRGEARRRQTDGGGAVSKINGIFEAIWGLVGTTRDGSG